MKLSEAYPSKYLAADDLRGQPVTVTIASAEVQEIGQGQDKDRKIVLTFSGKSKSLVCNKTNAKTIAKLYGDDTDDWIGKPIILAPREVEFQGDMVWAIRVSLQKPVIGGERTPVPPPDRSPSRAPVADEDVPF